MNSKDKKTNDPEAGEAEPEAISKTEIKADNGSDAGNSPVTEDVAGDAGESESKGPDGADEGEPEGADDNIGGEAGDKPEKRVRTRVLIIDHAYDGLLPVSLLAALIGALLGIIPATLLTYLTGIVFYPFFVAAPLLAYMFNSLLKGGRDIRAFIAISVFSLACAYTTALACQAALYISAHKMPIFEILLLTGLELGKSGVLPASASAYIYPLVFTVFGAAVSWELMRGLLRPTGEAEDIDAYEDPDSSEDTEKTEDSENAVGSEDGEDAEESPD